ncbi:hypothetical protein NHX12_011683 [Muraenolepis orangiensis]|uniref:Reverse transcriptase domain-containing protein n=1 Tax=Muraenolepis orangiensis TaxID=630683 RepID=A0A9Q0I7W1_9TELE|nr:hypothetical protein NHX12_011683 [Muraenolepis orangiensis]
MKDLESDIVELETIRETTGDRGYIEILKEKKMALANLLDESGDHTAPKKGNLQDIKNWRPVSLLCVDYKLLSKALATRLGRAVEQVIHRDQTYCVPGRSMVDNVHLIRDVLEVSSSLDINTGLISLDQEKAFDRVEHSFLWKVMEKFGFSAGFIAKIKVLYNNIESVLKFNGGLCAPFRVCRGVRQGCALSGMPYALSLEPLLN